MALESYRDSIAVRIGRYLPRLRGAPPMLDLLVKNGKVVLPDLKVETDVAIDDGKIVGLGHATDFPQANKVVDAGGRLVMPGPIDPHIHFIPGGRETWESVTRAQACGGLTSQITIFTQHKDKGLVDSVIEERKKADGKVAIDYALTLSITDLTDKGFSEIKKVIEYGSNSFKQFMIRSSYSINTEDGHLYRISKEVGKKGLVTVHAENTYIVEQLVARYVAEGKAAPIYYTRSRPSFVEEEAIQRFMAVVCELGGSRGYVVHTSTVRGVNIMKEGKLKGYEIYCETCPHYLVFTEDILNTDKGYIYAVNPSIKSAENREGLWQGIREGWVDTIGSDHVPWDIAQKEAGKESFQKMNPGFPGTELVPTLMMSEGLAKRGISVNTLSRVMSTNVAKIWSLFPKKGIIAPGSDADIMIFDPEPERAIGVEDLHMNCDFTIYEGMKVKGAPWMTISKGKIVMENMQYTGKAGDGQWLRRPAS